MKAATLREVRRGPELDELLLVDTEGRVAILKGYGLTADVAARTREVAFQLLSGAPTPARAADSPVVLGIGFP